MSSRLLNISNQHCLLVLVYGIVPAFIQDLHKTVRILPSVGEYVMSISAATYLTIAVLINDLRLCVIINFYISRQMSPVAPRAGHSCYCSCQVNLSLAINDNASDIKKKQPRGLQRQYRPPRRSMQFAGYLI